MSDQADHADDPHHLHADDPHLSRGNSFQGIKLYISLYSRGYPQHVGAVYDNVRLAKVTNNLQGKLTEFGYRGIAPTDLLARVIGNKDGPFELSGLPYRNEKLHRSLELRQSFVDQQKAFAAAVLGVIFSAEDSVARNSDTATFREWGARNVFNFKTGYRETIVYYVASEPDDAYRVTIQGIGRNTRETSFLFEPSEGWKICRYSIQPSPAVLYVDGSPI
jgi:hypothetical protein